MNDKELEETILKSQKFMKRSIELLMECKNEEGLYPKINFDPLIQEHQRICLGLKESRKPSLIIVPGVNHA